MLGGSFLGQTFFGQVFSGAINPATLICARVDLMPQILASSIDSKALISGSSGINPAIKATVDIEKC